MKKNIKKIKILQRVKKHLLKVMEEKLVNYSPETDYMPFQKAITGERYRAIFSFVHSISTTFGMSLWEQFAEILCKELNDGLAIADVKVGVFPSFPYVSQVAENANHFSVGVQNFYPQELVFP